MVAERSQYLIITEGGCEFTLQSFLDIYKAEPTTRVTIVKVRRPAW